MQELDDLQHMVEALQQTMDAIPEEIVAQYRTEEKGEINRERLPKAYIDEPKD